MNCSFFFCQQDVYSNLLPLYFPRTQSEENFAAYHLPLDVGNHTGEPIVADRQIRIAAKPTLQAERKKQTSLVIVQSFYLFIVSRVCNYFEYLSI